MSDKLMRARTLFDWKVRRQYSTCCVENYEGLIRREELSGVPVKTGPSSDARRGAATVV
jgi:hypothetical protein